MIGNLRPSVFIIKRAISNILPIMVFGLITYIGYYTSPELFILGWILLLLLAGYYVFIGIVFLWKLLTFDDEEEGFYKLQHLDNRETKGSVSDGNASTEERWGDE